MAFTKKFLLFIALAAHVNAFISSVRKVVPQSTTFCGVHGITMGMDRQAFLGVAAASLPILVANPMKSMGAKLEYLAEPTEEFKALEEKNAAFKQKQIAVKKLFREQLDKLAAASSEAELVDAIDSLADLVLQEQGLPAGLKKEALVKEIRVSKSKFTTSGLWTTLVERSYQELNAEIRRQQTPINKDTSNPL
uniref:Uncharacterized protein n=1 Tax=Fibrocapsa japonica TaxID=94617 RepID=A0A7S2V3N6_9STRA|mmetsp:Transcript_4832/g.7254  ORF Transcript_4832/g.7254 Transcript_4832/m.7254 type:complete len:193 (+) Transcript_4832:85-663(+)|eukprot:CAMPEP_0113936950 /NCGR_PEP_ID=MMETSP1339-20121228/3685_1 /TAXON_ID=94617 /ORGANISM="Fibrocapsa japonica" /LENGTH=192 /DNA_ID=CAMNT_0000939539 /DNA_START=82 /DNA_END=660 /DNA_ORIENTATION=- /assembly_acc=CAM_ASM_000762